MEFELTSSDDDCSSPMETTPVEEPPIEAPTETKETPSTDVFLPDQRSLGRFKNISYHGHAQDELISAMQKAVRKGNIKLAVYAVKELILIRELSNDITTVSQAKSVVTNLRNRIRHCFVEDVGPANRDLLPVLDVLLDDMCYDNDTKTIINVAATAVTLMCESKGARLASYCTSLMKIGDNPILSKTVTPYLPAFPRMKKEFDYLTKLRTRPHKHISHFKKALAKKSPVAITLMRWILTPLTEETSDVEDEKKKKSRKKKKLRQGASYAKSHPIFDIMTEAGLDKYLIGVARKWYNITKNGESWLHAAMPVLCWIYPYEHTIDDDDIDPLVYKVDIAAHKTVNDFPDGLPDYCYDMHTAKGRKQLGREKTSAVGVREWVETGSVVTNCDIPAKEAERKMFYKFSKLLSAGIVEPSLLFEASAIDLESIKPPPAEEKKSKKRKSPGSPSERKTKKKKKKEEVVIPDDALKESDLFPYVVRLQATTGRHKTDSFVTQVPPGFEDDNFGEAAIAVVKGPFPTDSDIPETLTELNGWRKRLGLNVVEFKTFNNVIVNKTFGHEEWSEGLARSNYRYNKKPVLGLFIMFQSLLKVNSEGEIKFRRYGKDEKQKSQAWIDSGAYIVKPRHLNTFVWHDKYYEPEILVDYINALHFRYLFGITDHADRNFIVKEEKMYDIDAESISYTNVMKYSSKYRKRSRIISSIIETNPEIRNSLQTTLDIWKEAIPEGSECIPRLDALIANPKLIFKVPEMKSKK